VILADGLPGGEVHWMLDVPVFDSPIRRLVAVQRDY
jgi:hypothetical protein